MSMLCIADGARHRGATHFKNVFQFRIQFVRMVTIDVPATCHIYSEISPVTAADLYKHTHTYIQTVHGPWPYLSE